MTMRTLSAVIGVAVVVGSGYALVAQGQSAPMKPAWTSPRTPWGHPDLGGVWANNNATPLERPKELEGRQFLTEEEVAELQKVAGELFDGNGDAAFGDAVFLAALRNVKERGLGYTSSDGRTGNYNSFWLVDREFDNRTSLVTDPADGRIPSLTDAARARAAAAAERRQLPPEGPQDIGLSQRCISPGVPNVFAGYNSYYQIFQTPDHVAIATEMYHDVRIVSLDGRPHVGAAIRGWNGDARGHWEGDTLVVDSTSFFSQGGTGASGIRVSAGESLHLVERFTRVGENTIHYEFTIDDATTWTKPWTAMIPLKKSADKIYEFACHEGNEGIVGTLNAARVQEAAAGKRGVPGRASGR